MLAVFLHFRDNSAYPDIRRKFFPSVWIIKLRITGLTPLKPFGGMRCHSCGPQ